MIANEPHLPVFHRNLWVLSANAGIGQNVVRYPSFFEIRNMKSKEFSQISLSENIL